MVFFCYLLGERKNKSFLQAVASVSSRRENATTVQSSLLGQTVLKKEKLIF
jgi:hypothetical protein